MEGEAMAMAAAWPPGVSSTAEMHRWPELVVKATFEKNDGNDAERMVRFLANCPMLSSSDYTGL